MSMHSSRAEHPGDWRLLIPTLCFIASLLGARFALATLHFPRPGAALFLAGLWLARRPYE